MSNEQLHSTGDEALSRLSMNLGAGGDLGRVDIQVFRPSDRHFGRQIPQIGTKSPILHKLSQMWLSAPL